MYVCLYVLLLRFIAKDRVFSRVFRGKIRQVGGGGRPGLTFWQVLPHSLRVVGPNQLQWIARPHNLGVGQNTEA